MLVFMQFSTKIDGFEQKDSQGFENSYNSYEQYPIREIFHFHHLPKLYFGFKSVPLMSEAICRRKFHGDLEHLQMCRTFEYFYTLLKPKRH